MNVQPMHEPNHQPIAEADDEGWVVAENGNGRYKYGSKKQAAAAAAPAPKPRFATSNQFGLVANY